MAQDRSTLIWQWLSNETQQFNPAAHRGWVFSFDKEYLMNEKIQLYREARLWLTQVILPLAGIALVVYNNDDLRASADKIIKKLRRK